ncbi:general secretion pathway protein GspB [Steroidobacter sp.]|uniref:general secretion pathway protein GspB n=1 Tax=Steroidobacter sp. TaxID=1978227 RepID=UPI001A565561|nr:general secretion pathway protein GspB [Steroidobacter sp.]MBL8270981.1 general secretion pathway protein GspB [Steroidobacter sp.]
MNVRAAMLACGIFWSALAMSQTTSPPSIEQLERELQHKQAEQAKRKQLQDAKRGQSKAQGEASIAGRADMKLNIHVYSANPSERFVFIDMRKHLVGSDLPNGFKVVSIDADGVRLARGTERVFLSRDETEDAASRSEDDEELRTQRARLEDLQKSYTDAHPEVIATKLKIQELESARPGAAKRR